MMKFIRNVLLIIPVLILVGCESAKTDGISLVDSSSVDLAPDSSQTSILASSVSTAQQEAETVSLSAETLKYSVSLTYNIYDEYNGRAEISPATLEVMNNSTGETYAASDSLYLGESSADDRLTIYSQPRLNILEFPDWCIAAVRVPEADKAVHKVWLYYFNDSTVQLLGNSRFYPFIPADSEIGIDAENNCFLLTDIKGDSARYTVVLDKNEPIYPYCLRSADHIAEPVVLTHTTAFGKISFSYDVYDRSDNHLKISAHNFVEFEDNRGEKHSCEVKSPVYQPAMSYDGLTDIEAHMELEIAALADWGVVAVRVPTTDPQSGAQLHVASFYYFDRDTFQQLGDGYFFPELLADCKIVADSENNCFSFTNADGVAERYTVVADTDASQHILLQPIVD